MGSQQNNSSSDTESNARKRVCKACDRCRLKKSKCDGASPCSRCRADNAICVFGERKKSHDKVYPKGYVEMLEQQQTQLVNGLRELYQRSIEADNWMGAPLKTAPNGFPLTHDILERLGALKVESTDDYEPFEDDFEALQQKAYGQEHEIMSPRSTNADSCPPSKRTSRNPQFLHNKSSLPTVQFPPTPPDQSPTEPSMATFDAAFTADTPMNIDSVNLHTSQPWLQSPDGDTDIDFINMDISAYSNLGLFEQKANPCLSMSTFNDDDLGGFGLTGIMS